MLADRSRMKEEALGTLVLTPQQLVCLNALPTEPARDTSTYGTYEETSSSLLLLCLRCLSVSLFVA